MSRGLKRKVLKFYPDFERDCVRWVHKFLKTNYWRVAPWMEYEDCIQDAYLHFIRIRDKYPEVLIRSHFFSLYVRTYTGHIHNMARDATKVRAERAMPEDSFEEGDAPRKGTVSMAACPQLRVPPVQELVVYLRELAARFESGYLSSIRDPADSGGLIPGILNARSV